VRVYGRDRDFGEVEGGRKEDDVGNLDILVGALSNVVEVDGREGEAELYGANTGRGGARRRRRGDEGNSAIT
jgi:hypothetical protein